MPRREARATGPFSRAAVMGMVSLLFLVGIAILLCRRTVGDEPVQADTEPHYEPQKDTRAGRYYVVRRGDTLEALARHFYRDPLAWQRIARANGIARPRQLRAGRVIWIPHPPAR